MTDENQQIVAEFLTEAVEILDNLDQQLVALESDPTNQNAIHSIFRAVHTLKGTSGFLGFVKLEKVAHVGENLLDDVRAGRLQLDVHRTSSLLKLIDALRTILKNIAGTQSEGDEEYKELIETLNDCRKNEPTKEVPKVEAPPQSTTIQEPSANKENEVDPLESIFLQAQQEYASESSVKQDVQVKKELAPKSVDNFKEATAVIPQQPSQDNSNTETKAADDEKRGQIADTSLRVDVNLLDQLMNLVGELVLARNQILQFTKSQSDSDFVNTSQRLNLITSELQESVMKTRMQPIATVWNKFPRVVRDIARMCNKKVKIEMEGKETDLDKTIIEAIKDPLTHIVRNSVDHGIELPEIREKKGKNPEGTLLLKAFHEGGHVIIEISDDGGGLNTERIKAKALEKGLVTAEKLSRMSEYEINKLIFLPGFSTAEQVTNISGRGVGMDVVRCNIEKIGGAVDLTSKFGEGTTLKIKIPLTLAIVPTLIVSTHKERFAIPQVSLVELVRVEPHHINDEIEEIKGSLFYRLRGDLLPLVFLSHELKLSQNSLDTKSRDTALNIVVVKADERVFGLVVDQVHDTEEIVVKPLSKQLKNIDVFAGATIMGDGHVALIVDVLGLARRANVIGSSSEVSEEREIHSTGAASIGSRKTLLIVQTGEGIRSAIPLESVNRLEEFPTSIIESAAGKKVVQYRGGILPIIDLPEYFTGKQAQGDETKHVVVFTHQNKQCGFVVDKIVDIIEDNINLQMEKPKAGIVGSAIIDKHITDLLDLSEILNSIKYNEESVR